jgi:hypothetical protein
MGHRALVADARSNRGDAATDGFTVWYSHWGAHAFALIDALDSTQSSASAAETQDSSSELHSTGATLGRASDVAAFATEFVDPTMNEAAFVVSPDATVRTYLPLPATVGPGSPDSGGVLLELRDDPHPVVDARPIRSWARKNRLDGRPVPCPGSPTTPDVVLDRFHDAVAKAFPERERHRIPPATECTQPRASTPQTSSD